MAKEEVILEFKVEQGNAIADLEKTKKEIVSLKEEQKQLNEAYKKGNITLDEYASESVRVEQILKNQTNTYSKLTHQVQGTKSMTDQLKGSLQTLAPGLNSSIEGFAGMTKAAIKFIATPIGAVVAALGIAIYALKSYFNSSEEAQDRFNKIVNVGKGIFERYMNVVEGLGEVIYELTTSINGSSLGLDAFTKKFGAFGIALDVAFAPLKLLIGSIKTLGDIFDRFFPEQSKNIKEFFSSLEQEAERFTKLQSDIDKRERDLLVQRAQTNKEVAKLREDAIHQEGEAKRESIEKAIELERGLVNEEVKLAESKKQLAEAELKRNGDDKAAKEKVAQATAELINVQAQRYEATLRFEKQLEALDQAEQKLYEAELKRNEDLRLFSEEQKAKEAEDREAEIEELAEHLINKNAVEESLNQNFADIEAEQEAERADKSLSLDNTVSRQKQAALLATHKLRMDLMKQGMTEEQANAKIHQALEQQKLAQTSDALSMASGLFKQNTVAYKVTSTAKAVIDTYSAANLALSSYPPPLGAIFAALNIALGLVNVGKITGIAAAGGAKFMTKGPTLLLVGDNPGGRERVEVTPVSGRGVTRTFGGGRGVAMAGGGSIDGSILAAASTRNLDTQFDLQSVMGDQQIGVTFSETEYTRFKQKLTFKEELTQA